MIKKGTKIHNRVRKIQDKTLIKLYDKLPTKCQSCCFNANCSETDGMNNETNCINYKEAISLNELIIMMKNQNIDLESFYEKFRVKKEFFLEMISGKMLMSYKYYIAICTRLHVREMDEFYSYEERFLSDDNINNNSTENNETILNGGN